MPRESLQQKSTRVARIVRVLNKTYPDAHCELNHTSPLELLIATILSAQCTDKQVNLVTADLFKKYRAPKDYAQADPVEFANDIRRIGLFRNKAKNIQAACRALVSGHGGAVPRTMEELTALAGVGRKTANVVLGTAFGINVGVVVDTHVARLSERLGLTTESNPVNIERALMKLTTQDQWALMSHWLIWHGRRRCEARKPGCGECEIARWCPSAESLHAP